MCFGNQTTSTTTNQSTPNPAVAAAATQNLTAAQNLQNAGFTPYTGQQVANFSPQQQSSFDMTNNIANNGTAPAATSMIDQYASAPAQSVSPETISSQMSPYMNQYVMQALAPQLQQMNMANAATNAATDAQATGSGAYGDARTGIQQANNAFNQNVAQEGVIGNAYNNAFNTAIGAGAQDVSNNLQGQTTNANLAETALQRSLGGANALEGLQTQQLGVAGAQNTMGAQQTAQQQANLTAQCNQWLMAQQYPFQTSQLLDQATSAGAQAMPATTTSTTQQPNNSGWALAGALGSAALAPFTGGLSLGALPGFLSTGSAITGAVGATSVNGAPLTYSDARLKEDIVPVGKLLDDTPIYHFKYKGDKTPRIGVMAQDIVKRDPEAVKELWAGGPMVVDYDRVTAPSRMMAMAV